MKERARRMAEDAYILNRANTVVICAENKYLADLTSQLNLAASEEPSKVDKLLDKLTDEKERLSPEHKWDEEEVQIALMERRGKRKG
jgi:hypothetical protein